MIENLNIAIVAVLITSAFMVVTSSNLIFSILFLIISYISVAIILLLLKVEFLALIIINIYIGAIAVIFLFIILMIDIKNSKQPFTSLTFYFCYSVIIGFIFLVEVTFLSFDNFQLNNYYFNNWFFTNLHENWFLKIDALTDIEILGQILSVNFVMHLLIAGLILFLSLIGSIFLTYNFNYKKTHVAKVYKQLSKSISKNLI